jgi:hypothetical protein
MMLSPGYSYDKAPDQQHFTGRESSMAMFRRILSNRDPRWQFNMSPLFLEFLMGKRHLECTPWGMPAYSIFGWQRPCYLMQEGYADTYQELLDTTDWRRYGYESGNPKCANCMMHSGYEASAVDYTFSFRGVFATVRAMLTSKYRDEEARRQVESETPVSPLVQIAMAPAAAEKATLQGAGIAREQGLSAAIEEAFDYRGDVTLELAGGGKLEGYIFDRDARAGRLRMMVRPGARKQTVEYAQIERLVFSGRDMADGRSWEAWVRKYAERKAAGETNIELAPEALD